MRKQNQTLNLFLSSPLSRAQFNSLHSKLFTQASLVGSFPSSLSHFSLDPAGTLHEPQFLQEISMCSSMAAVETSTPVWALPQAAESICSRAWRTSPPPSLTLLFPLLLLSVFVPSSSLWVVSLPLPKRVCTEVPRTWLTGSALSCGRYSAEPSGKSCLAGQVPQRPPRQPPPLPEPCRVNQTDYDTQQGDFNKDAKTCPQSHD